jgi:hypothetical protein
MKITKIEISDFRGFPGKAPYDFEFGNARNLFIWGENGSGKTSLCRAIQEFFNLSKDAKSFTDHKNTLDPACVTGHVAVHFDDGSIQSWQCGGDRPLRQPPALQTALQVGCLTYRNLLETNFTQHGDNVNLFDIAVWHLLPHVEVATSIGSRRIVELWEYVESINPARKGHYKSYIDNCDRAINRFNTGFQPLIQPLIDKATELLSRFNEPDLTLGAAFRKVEYDRTTREFKNTDLLLSVLKSGTQLQKHHNFLNEARLSAIAIAIYLAGLLISVPGTSPFPKLLVLDDVLVGLDMANRLPVLSILAEYFADWQIILLTYDRVWYEMVQVDLDAVYLRTDNWRFYELWLDKDGVTPVHCWRGNDGGFNFFLSRAQEHLNTNDFRAAGVYARAAFETKLKIYCDKKGVPVPYRKPPKHIDAETFWRAAVKHALEAARKVGNERVLAAHFRFVYRVKQVVLNPLSHSATQPIARPEIQAAIDAVRTLRFE